MLTLKSFNPKSAEVSAFLAPMFMLIEVLDLEKEVEVLGGENILPWKLGVFVELPRLYLFFEKGRDWVFDFTSQFSSGLWLRNLTAVVKKLFILK